MFWVLQYWSTSAGRLAGFLFTQGILGGDRTESINFDKRKKRSRCKPAERTRQNDGHTGTLQYIEPVKNMGHALSLKDL